ncbi:hypothetical protein JXO59_08025 [candidate division KSB1 bacterium]|nr:hypothetical protein [candidate division KSB1 bacterium]
MRKESWQGGQEYGQRAFQPALVQNNKMVFTGQACLPSDEYRPSTDRLYHQIVVHLLGGLHME